MCLVVIKISVNPALESQTQGAENGNMCQHYSDPLVDKWDGMFRHACLNAGNFMAENEDGMKFSDLCEVIRKCDIDALSLLEHGLNPLN